MSHQSILADLHVHTFYSEGQFSPKEIIQKTKAQGIKILAIADHNTITGAKEALKFQNKYKIKVIPAVEIYSHYKNKNLHILGYGIDLENPSLNRLLKKTQNQHQHWAMQVLIKLESLGFKVDFSKINRFKSEYLGFTHLVKVIYSKSKNKQKIFKEIKPHPNIFEIINHYFVKSKRAFVPDVTIPATAAIKTIQKAKGIPILAHPGQQLVWEDDSLILELKRKGLKGIEVLSPYHSWHQIEHYQKLAFKNKFLITGGSDYHFDIRDPEIKNPLIKRQWDYFKVPSKIIKPFLAKIK